MMGGLSLIAFTLLSVANNEAQIIAYDGFNYTGGANLTGLNGGTPVSNPGWTAAWKLTAGSETTTTVAPSGLSYTDGHGNTLVVAGNSIQDPDASKHGNGRTVKYTSSSLFTTGTSVWMSALVKSTYTGVTASNLVIMPFCPSNDPGNTPGDGINITSSNLGVTVSSDLGGINSSTLAGTSGSTMLIVAKLTFGGGGTSDSITTWVNPFLDTTPSTGGVTANGTSTISLFTATSTTFAVRGGSPWTGFMDEFRVGLSFNDVVPQVAVVPEPSTFALVGFGCVGLLMVLRRRKSAMS